MANVKFVTWNVRGLRNKVKRTAALAFIKSQKADIIAITETHITGQLQVALKKPWIGWLYHSTHTNQSRGVSILIAKRVPFELITLESDRLGRYIFLHATIGGNSLLILACYTPPLFSIEVVLKGLAFMAQNPSVPAVWMGDFNQTMSPILDRPGLGDTSRVIPHQTRLCRLFTEFALTDVWRWQNPTKKAYTCHSVGSDTMSRIDFILVSNSLFPKITESGGIRPLTLLDNSIFIKSDAHLYMEAESILVVGYT